MKYGGKERSKKTGWIILIVIIALLLLSVFVLKEVFTVTSVIVEGNEHYTEDEIKKFVITDGLNRNSLYLYIKYKYFDTEEIPFIDTLEVEYKKPSEIKITVYEKDIVGYVDYIGNFMYFDKDGIIVESSTKVLEGTPLISGLHFDHIILHEKLPVADTKVFRSILDISRLLKKHEISTDKIAFDEKYEITLGFGDAKVFLGDDENLEEKIVRMKSILPQLSGLKGTLHMENFDENTKNITFEKEN